MFFSRLVPVMKLTTVGVEYKTQRAVNGKLSVVFMRLFTVVNIISSGSSPHGHINASHMG